VLLACLCWPTVAQYVATTPAPRDNLVAISEATAFAKTTTDDFGEFSNDKRFLRSTGTIRTWVNIPHDTPPTRLTSDGRPYLLKLGAKGDLTGGEFPKIEVRIDGNVVDSIDVKTQSCSQPFSITTNIRSGLRRVELMFANDFYNGSTTPVQDSVDHLRGRAGPGLGRLFQGVSQES